MCNLDQLRNDNKFMQLALNEASKAFNINEVPIGAILVDQNNNIISKAYNKKEKKMDATAHAEIEVIKKASKKIQSWRLNGCTIYVTLEPCIMCMATLVHARIKRVVFGTYDLKGGSICLDYKLYKDKRLNHNFSIMGGLLANDCSMILKKFFKKMRK